MKYQKAKGTSEFQLVLFSAEETRILAKQTTEASALHDRFKDVLSTCCALVSLDAL